MSIKDKIPDEIRKLLKNAPTPVIRIIMAKLTRKKSEDKMSFVEFKIHLINKSLLSGSAEITLGKKKFTVSLYPTEVAKIYRTSPIPCELEEKIAIYTIDGTIKLLIDGEVIEEYFSSVAINNIHMEKLL